MYFVKVTFARVHLVMLECSVAFDRCWYLSVTVGVDGNALRDHCLGVN